MRQKRRYLYICLFSLLLYSCGKTPPFEQVDPGTGQPPVDLTPVDGDCYVVKIAQKNKNSSSNDNAFIISRNAVFLPTRIVYYDSLTNKTDYDITMQLAADTLRLSTGEYFVLDKNNKQVLAFSTRSDMSDPLSDNMLYRYSYDAAGYLSKKQVYINGASTATYLTEYTYDNNAQLTTCIMYAGSKKIKSLESVLEYDYTQSIKPWLYLFPDFFEGYHYLQALNFGKKPTYQVKRIITKIYDTDAGSVLDTWNTTFTGYVTSKDKFVLQTTANGDQQQGLGFLYGTTRFDYSCSK